MTDTLPLPGDTQAAAVLERLEARQEARKAEREQRQQELERVADPREDINQFLAAFVADHGSLQQRCGDIEQRAASSGQTEEGKQGILQQLEDLACDVGTLEQKTSDAAYFLPSYELRSCNNHLQQLRAQMAAIKQQLQPKRKFAFSRATKKAPAASALADSIQQDSSQPQSHTAAAAEASIANHFHAPQQNQQAPVAPSAHDLQLINAGYGCMGLRSQTIVKSTEQLAGQAFVLQDLVDCTVFLLGHLSALRLQQLNNCKIYTGPVSGATFVNGVSNCTLMIASHQVRIHNAVSCDFHLRVRSRPIIEHSSKLRFAPYPVDQLSAPQQQQQQEEEEVVSDTDVLQQLFEAGQLAAENDLWQQVDDFGWVKSTQSPNWSVLPDAERQMPLLPQH